MVKIPDQTEFVLPLPAYLPVCTHPGSMEEHPPNISIFSSPRHP